MKRLTPSLFLLLFLAQNVFAQSDSVKVATAKWETKRIARGVQWKHYWFKDQTLFGAPQNINIVEVKPRRKIILDLGYEPQELKITSEFGKKYQALAALNGTFFDIKNGGSVDFIQSDGQVINTNWLDKGNQRALHQRAALIFKNGRLAIAKWDGTENWERTLSAEDIMVSGPLLHLNNKPEPVEVNTFNTTRHPRTVVVVTKDKRTLLVTVDGRHENATGMSMTELSQLTRWLAAKDAINLDGGGSTTLWVNGLPYNGVVNDPSDVKAWDHTGERKVANVVLVKKCKKK